MESVARNTLYRSMNAPDLSKERRRENRRESIRRIAEFARPHRGKLAVFMVLSVVVARG